MSYGSIADMAKSGSLLTRVAACASAEGVDNPLPWANANMWEIAASPSWGEKWDYAKDTWQVNANPDFGARTDVIGDADILAAVQQLAQAQGLAPRK